jgi:NADPH-dependent curcumin reductase CurA
VANRQKILCKEYERRKSNYKIGNLVTTSGWQWLAKEVHMRELQAVPNKSGYVICQLSLLGEESGTAQTQNYRLGNFERQ